MRHYQSSNTKGKLACLRRGMSVAAVAQEYYPCSWASLVRLAMRHGIELTAEQLQNNKNSPAFNEPDIDMPRLPRVACRQSPLARMCNPSWIYVGAGSGR